MSKSSPSPSGVRAGRAAPDQPSLFDEDHNDDSAWQEVGRGFSVRMQMREDKSSGATVAFEVRWRPRQPTKEVDLLASRFMREWMGGSIAGLPVMTCTSAQVWRCFSRWATMKGMAEKLPHIDRISFARRCLEEAAGELEQRVVSQPEGTSVRAWLFGPLPPVGRLSKHVAQSAAAFEVHLQAFEAQLPATVRGRRK